MFVLALYLPVVLFAMYCEYKAMIYALPPQVAILGPLEPKVFRPFTSWILFAFSTSRMDLATNSVFLAKVLATDRCGAKASKCIQFNRWRVHQTLFNLRLLKSGQIFQRFSKLFFRSQGSALELGKAVSPTRG